jgi:hypothetical protein
MMYLLLCFHILNLILGLLGNFRASIGRTVGKVLYTFIAVDFLNIVHVLLGSVLVEKIFWIITNLNFSHSGGFLFSMGLIGFLFWRNPVSLTFGVAPGLAILALGVLSLKVWRSGKSSLPFILAQAGKFFSPITR